MIAIPIPNHSPSRPLLLPIHQQQKNSYFIHDYLREINLNLNIADEMYHLKISPQSNDASAIHTVNCTVSLPAQTNQSTFARSIIKYPSMTIWLTIASPLPQTMIYIYTQSGYLNYTYSLNY